MGFISTTDPSNGKTALLKAFLNLKDGRNDAIEVLIDAAEKTLDSESFINAAYTDPYYKGQKTHRTHTHANSLCVSAKHEGSDFL